VWFKIHSNWRESIETNRIRWVKRYTQIDLFIKFHMYNLGG
jgi:hypothetical protein